VRRGLLDFHERAALIAKINSGLISKQQLLDMQLAPSDEDLLTWYLPRVVKWGTPSNTPEELRRIAADVEQRASGQPLRDPVGFLLHGSEEDVKRLIDDEEDWRVVERERLKHNNH
jgi:hypothetical protein